MLLNMPKGSSVFHLLFAFQMETMFLYLISFIFKLRKDPSDQLV